MAINPSDVMIAKLSGALGRNPRWPRIIAVTASIASSRGTHE
jgi:hypothetical protein